MTQSEALFEKSKQVIPGGVNSPVRAFKSVGGTPVFMKSAKGAILTDVDGKEYIDYIGSWGPMIWGHAYPAIIKAIADILPSSTSFGAPTELEFLLAAQVVKMVPGIDKVRFVSSGTEACMSAVRLARAYTNRNLLVKFEGCYHGHADPFLAKAGSGALTFGMPDSPGVPKETTAFTLNLPYNDFSALRDLFAHRGEEIACVIIEPVAGNMGCVLPETGFLQELRTLCREYETLLIFDEVMTGFRLAKGGVQELYGILADIVTFGKIIGGGLPVGAYAARADIMNMLSPEGPVYQAGTLSGNPVAMAAGLAALSLLDENPPYQALEQYTRQLAEGIGTILSEKGIPHVVNQIGSMLSVHFCPNPVTDLLSAKAGINDTFKQFFHHCLQNGVYLPPSAFEAWFVSAAHGVGELEKSLEVFEKF